jgi:hypothetical protein
MILWIFAAVFSIVFCFQLMSFINSLRIYNGTADRRSHDASHEGHPVPDTAMTDIIDLQALGLTRLGELGTQLPSENTPTITWVFTDPEQTTIAEMVLLGPPLSSTLVSFSSSFYDNANLSASYPVGENFDYPGDRSLRVTTSLADAYHLHKQNLADYTHLHGQPIPMKSIQDVLKSDAIYRQYHAKRKLRRSLIRHFLQLLSIGLAAALSIIQALQIFTSPTVDGILTVAILLSLLYPGYLQRRIRS